MEIFWWKGGNYFRVAIEEANRDRLNQDSPRPPGRAIFQLSSTPQIWGHRVPILYSNDFIVVQNQGLYRRQHDFNCSSFEDL